MQPTVLKSIPVDDQAFYRVGIDLLKPITETPRKTKYIAVAIDYLTKWAEVRAIPDKKSETVAEYFEEDITARHGCPRIVLSDDGLEFKGDFDELLFSSMELIITIQHQIIHRPMDSLKDIMVP